MHNFLISRLSSLGDVVCTLPVASVLKEAFPDSHVTWVVDRRFASVVECCSAVDEVVVLSSRLPGYSRSFDVAFDMQGLAKSALAIARARAGLKLGYHWQREGARLFSSPVVPDATSFHIVDQYVDVARCAVARLGARNSGLGPGEEALDKSSFVFRHSSFEGDRSSAPRNSEVPLENRGASQADPHLPPPNRRGRNGSDSSLGDSAVGSRLSGIGWAESALDDSSFVGDGATVARHEAPGVRDLFALVPDAEALAKMAEFEGAVLLNPGAGWVSKRWPPSHFADLIRILQSRGMRTVLIGGPDTVAASAEILALAQSESLVGKTSLKELIAAISVARAHVGGDTGSTHIAAAVGTRAVGLYSITNPRRSCPYGQVENCLYEPAGLGEIGAEAVAAACGL
jgi:ADP-heptose:LPS heptosyltransferase